MDLIINNPARWLIFYLCFLLWVFIMNKASKDSESFYAGIADIVITLLGIGAIAQFIIVISCNL